ncbi:MAG: site-specific integrase, partial [Microcystis wesenbergii Mw_MB_S_20031200_S109]
KNMWRAKTPQNINRASPFYTGRLFISEVKPRAFKPTFWVTRKGKDKNHTVPICSELRTRLKDYFPSLNPDDYLFQGLNGRLSYEAALIYLKKSAIKVGLDDKKIVTHCGRRSCITELARSGTDISTIQAVSGHASLQSLQRYIENDPDRSKRALENIFS